MSHCAVRFGSGPAGDGEFDV